MALATIAGFVDTIGFLSSGGFFVSFMSGNSTRLGIGFARDVQAALAALGVIAAFVTGVAAMTWLVNIRQSMSRKIMLVGIAAIIVLAALTPEIYAVALMASAMGAMNVVLADRGKVRFGLTYMTGALVRIGQGVGHHLSRTPSEEWRPYLLLWIALVAGCGVSAELYQRMGMSALWIAAAALITIAVLDKFSER